MEKVILGRLRDLSKVTWLISDGPRECTPGHLMPKPMPSAPVLLGQEFRAASHNQGRFGEKLPQEDSKIVRKAVNFLLLCRVGT